MPPQPSDIHYIVARDPLRVACRADLYGFASERLDDMTCEECRDRVLAFALAVVRSYQ